MNVLSCLFCQEIQLISSRVYLRRESNSGQGLIFLKAKQLPPNDVFLYMKNDISPFSMILTSPFVETVTLELLRKEPLTFLCLMYTPPS